MRAGRLVRRVVVTFVIGGLVLEAALQAASLLAPLMAPVPETAIDPGVIRVLLVGDSHAAGAGAPHDQRLSDHLERMLSARHPEREFQVVNLGRAGLNSAYVANRLEANVLAYRPLVVIVWVGVNDLWNTLETESWGTSEGRLRLRRLLLHSKVYRLLTVLWYTRDRDETRAVAAGPSARRNSAPWRRALPSTSSGWRGPPLRSAHRSSSSTTRCRTRW